MGTPLGVVPLPESRHEVRELDSLANLLDYAIQPLLVGESNRRRRAAATDSGTSARPAPLRGASAP